MNGMNGSSAHGTVAFALVNDSVETGGAVGVEAVEGDGSGGQDGAEAN